MFQILFLFNSISLRIKISDFSYHISEEIPKFVPLFRLAKRQFLLGLNHIWKETPKTHLMRLALIILLCVTVCKRCEQKSFTTLLNFLNIYVYYCYRKQSPNVFCCHLNIYIYRSHYCTCRFLWSELFKIKKILYHCVYLSCGGYFVGWL